MNLGYNYDLSKLPGLTTGHTTNADNPFEPFFGPVSVQDGQGVKAGDVFSHETYNLPDAYAGKNAFLEDIMDWVITNTDEWYTSRVLPWRYTDQLSVQWNVWRFNKTMADLEPHQGVPRYVTAESESHSDRLVRRGLAFIIEHGFWTTPRGRKHYMMNLEQITSAVHETVYYGVLHALLSGKNHYKEWQRQYGRRVTRIDDLLRRERNSFACAQKSPRGMFLLDAQLKEMMKFQGIKPDTWILPSKLGVYLTMVPSNQVSQVEVGSGSKAVANNNSNTATYNTLTVFRGSHVCETRPFDTDFSGEPTELLRREKMIGEFYLALPHYSPNGTDYKSDHRSIWIFNMDIDRFEKVGLEEMIPHCFRFNDDAEGLPTAAHDAIQMGYGIPQAKEVAMRDDPLMCHFDNDYDPADGSAATERAVRKKPNGTVGLLGDVGLEHFRDSDIRDWAETVRRSYHDHTGDAATLDKVLTWYLKDVIGAGMSNKVVMDAVRAFAATGTGAAAPSGGKGSGMTTKTTSYDIHHKLAEVPLNFHAAVQQAWDPSLGHELLGAEHPEYANLAFASVDDIVSKFRATFPDQWKNLLNADDFVDARKTFMAKVDSVRNEPDKVSELLSHVNDQYAQTLTEKAVSRRATVTTGLLADVLSELQTQAIGTRSRGLTEEQKKVKQFLKNFKQTVQFFKQTDEDAFDKDQSVMDHIIRNYIAPLHSEDAESMQEQIESHVMSDSVLTPQILDNWLEGVQDKRSAVNLEQIARALQPSGVAITSRTSTAAASSAVRARLDVGSLRKGGSTDFARDVRAEMGAGQTGDLTANVAAKGSGSVEFRTRLYNKGDELLTSAGAGSNLNIAKAYKLMFMGTRVSRKVLEKFAEYDILCPFGFLLMRPFMRYDMCSAILCQSGADLGQTFMGHNDFQLTDDIIHKVHVGHYTFYSKSIIHNEKKYTIAEDVFSSGYKNGENTRFYRSKEALMEDIHAEAFRSSIICHLVPYRTNQPQAPRIHSPLDVTGRLHPTLYQDTDIPENELVDAMYPGARFAAEVLELKKLTAYASDATEHFLSPFKYLNTICFQGPQFLWNNGAQQFSDRIEGTGHFGNHRYNGCKGVVCGDMDYFREVHPNDLSPM